MSRYTISIAFVAM